MATRPTTGTTDGARRRLAQVSVRTRITVVIALLTTAAMTGAGLLVYALESSRIQRAVESQITQEIAEFRNLRRDPKDGREFDDVRRVLKVFLTRNVPDDDEMLVGYVRGEQHHPSPATATARSSSTSRPTTAPWTSARSTAGRA